MIPKRIIQIWVGNTPPSDFELACCESVERLHPDWEYRVEEISEPILYNGFSWFDPFAYLSDEIAALRKRFNLECFFNRCAQYKGSHSPKAIQCDLARLVALYCFGGFYLDHDMYCVQPLDKFVNEDIVFGQISEDVVAEGLIGCRENDPRILEILTNYLETQTPEAEHCGMGLGGYCYNKIKTHPPEYFVPHRRTENSDEAKYRHTANTHTIHCWRQNQYDLKKLEAIGEKLRKKNKIEVPPLDHCYAHERTEWMKQGDGGYHFRKLA